MTRIVIVGAGGFGREVLGILSDLEGFEAAGFLDADERLWGADHCGLPVLGGDDTLERAALVGFEAVALALGNTSARRGSFARAQQLRLALPALVHPRAYVAPDVSVGAATIVYPGAVVMTGCVLGNGVLVNAGATLGHEVVLDDFCSVNPGAHLAGRIRVESGAMVGIGSSVLENLRIGARARVGGGAVVTRDVPADCTVVGVPARIPAGA